MEVENSEATIVGSPVRQLSVFLRNQPGSLLSIVRLLGDRHVMVLGVSVQDSADVTIVRLITSDPDLAETLFIEKGIPYNAMEMTVIELREGAASLADCLQSLLNAETNIYFVYPILNRPNDRAALALCLEDNDFGRSVLVKEGFKILFQEDLSR